MDITLDELANSPAMEIAGHRTREVFERYNIFSEGDLQRAQERLSDYLKGYRRADSVREVADSTLCKKRTIQAQRVKAS
jgi:hypothetical protein